MSRTEVGLPQGDNEGDEGLATVSLIWAQVAKPQRIRTPRPSGCVPNRSGWTTSWRSPS